MTEGDPFKRDEQFPLLMVSGGSGDGGGRASPKTMSSMWNVTSYTPRRSCFERWPEYLSTCWMTLVLLGITFLVFYAIGMMAYKREGYILVKCNENKTASNVFLHHLVPRLSNGLAFANYADFISRMAAKYQSLQFNVIFLVDDASFRTYGLSLRHHGRYLMPTIRPRTFTVEEREKRQINEFKAINPNVDVHTVLLSHFMGMTPLKHKWHMLPTSLLTFYARVYSVWQQGGIGIDLAAYNNNFKRNISDWRLDAILKEHDNGIESQPTEPTSVSYKNSNNVNQDKEGEFFKQVLALLQHVVSNSRNAFFNVNLTTPNATEMTSEQNTDKELPNLSVDRTKRDVIETGQENQINSVNASKQNHVVVDLITIDDDDKKNFYNVTSNATVDTNATPVTIVSSVNDSAAFAAEVNKTEIPEEFVILYDISLMVGPSRESEQATSRQTGSVTIDSDGRFVSATSSYHPFLAQLVNAGPGRMLPRTAIFDALMNQCNAFLRDDIYCNNIHVI